MTKELRYEDDVPGILYAGQARYARYPSRNRFFRGARSTSMTSGS